MREGAQDYLVKGQTDGDLLLQAIRYATERKKIEEEIRLNEARSASLLRISQYSSESIQELLDYALDGY